MRKLDEELCDLDCEVDADAPTRLARAMSQLSEEYDCSAWGPLCGSWGLELVELGALRAVERLSGPNWVPDLDELRRLVDLIIATRAEAGGGWVVWLTPETAPDHQDGLWYVDPAELAGFLRAGHRF